MPRLAGFSQIRSHICNVHFVGGKILIITVILLLNFSLGKTSSDPQSPSHRPSIFGRYISATQRAQIQRRYESVEKRRQQKDKEERKRIENVKEREKAIQENELELEVSGEQEVDSSQYSLEKCKALEIDKR